jgi:transcriptional regulator with XRE-family HTH domain
MLDVQTQGERVATLASAAGLSQRDLAEAADMSQATVSRIVTGKRRASVPELVALAWALGVPYEELVETPPLSERVLVAPRSSLDEADLSAVRSRLVGYLRMELYLDAQGVAAVR